MAEKSSTYFIPPELRKHVQLIKELPEIVADTVTDPDTYVALNELLNPVKWIESAGQKSGKFFESGGKDIESGAEALIETLGLAAGPMAQKYASTLAPMVSRGVGSGVKSLQELVMPLGATDDVAKKVPQKEGISRRDFIAGGTALGTLAGLKQAGDLLPTTKGAVKVAAKTPLASTIKALNSIKSNYKKVSNERKLIEDSIFDLKSNPSKWVEDTYSAYKEHTPEELLELKKLEKLSDTTQMKVIKSVDSMEEKIGSLVSSLLKQSKKDLMKLNDDQLKSLRGHLTDNYYYSGFGTTKYVKFQPSDHFSIRKEPVDPKDFFKPDLADKTRMRKLTSSKESSEKTDYEKIVLRVDEVLEERGLTTIEDVNKLKERLLKNIRNMNYPGYKAFYNQGGLTTDEQTQQAFNQGGYGVAGKFTPDTGVSAAKEKGTFEGLGYKGEAKEAPAETKTFQEPVDMSSGGDDDKTVRPLIPDPFEEKQFDKYKKVDPEVYTNLKFQQTDKDGPLGFLGEPTGQTLKERQEEVKRIKRFSGLSETAEMAKARVKNSVFNRLKELSKTTVEYNPETKVSEIVSGTNKLFQDPKNITDVQKSMEYFNIKAPMIQAVIESGFLINAPNDFDNFIFNEKTGEYDLGRNRFVGNLDENDPNQVKAIHNFYTQATGAETIEELDIYNPESSWFWCSAFIHDILTKVNAKPLETSNSFDRIRARKYIDYGTKIADLKKDGSIDLSKIKSGDILIIGDPNTFLKGGPEEVGAITHLTIFVGDDIEGAFDVSSKYSDKRLLGLGGNQSSSKSLAEVNVKPFSVNEIIGVRRIDKVTPKMIDQLKKDNPQYKGFVESATPPVQRPEDFYKNLGIVEKAKEPMKRPKEFNKGGLTTDQQMSSLLRKPIKAHKGTIVDGQIRYEKDNLESTTTLPKESTPVATHTVEPTPVVSTPALAVTPPPSPPPAPTTQQPVQQATPTPQPVEQPLPPPLPTTNLQQREFDQEFQANIVNAAKVFVPETVQQMQSMSIEDATRFNEMQQKIIEESRAKFLRDIEEKRKRTGIRGREALDNMIKPVFLMTPAERKEFGEKLREDRRNRQASASKVTNQPARAPKQQMTLSEYARAMGGKYQQSLTNRPAMRLPQPYRPTQEERFELNNLNNIVMSSPEYKLLQKEGNEFGKIQQKELGSYQRKVNEALRQFGPQSQEFKNALESMQFQNRLFVKQYAPTMQRLNKLQSDLNNSDAAKNFDEARNRIFKRQQINTRLPSQFNKGGMSMEQQMSLFEEGGMKDDGLDRDPVSGNEIPPGSLAREVRDDIPAQLSDGEYVVPADVVQYFGVKFFEDIRAEAKAGLAEMEATGRIGGEPVKVDMTMIAFGKAKEEEEKKKKAQGGLMGYSNGGTPTVDDDYFKQQAIAKANPTAGFQRVGQSLFGQTQQGNVPMPGTILITKTFYHPDGRIQAVQGTMRGNPPVFVPNQGFDQFTKAPWSETPPAQTQATTQKQERDDSKDPQFVSTETLANDPDFKGMGGVVLRDAKGNIISMTKQGYGAVLTSANRLGIPMQEYHNLPLLSKAKLIGQEIKSGFGGEVDQDYIDEVVEGAKNNPENISILERFLNFITGGKSKKTEDTGTTTPTGNGGGNGGGGDGDDDFHEQFSKTADVATPTEQATIGSGRNVTGDQKSETQADLSKAYGGSDDGNLAAGKFGGNKGGLLQKPKPKTRKPRGKGLGNKK